jgi:ADP-ribosylglycohydrolase
MNKIVFNTKDYYNRIYAGWTGKNIGGTLGGPVEGRMQLLDLTFYPKAFDGPVPNDDLDLQLVWLHVLEQYGARLTAKELGNAWLEHVFFPYDEYGYALTNLRLGLVPPVCGSFNNPFTNCMGSPIRSEIWAMIAPGAPEVAAYYAYQDAIVDHAGGEGVYGEVFFAAIESAAFVEKDMFRLINYGLKCIPDDCRTSKAIKDLLKWHQEGLDWIKAREKILEYHGNKDNFTDAPQNIAFTILGWLYGTDFGDSILKAVNCGYDTDCTGATLGAILGIVEGLDYIDKKWSEPIGENIKVSPAVKGFNAPSDLKELTERTVKISREIAAYWDLPLEVSDEKETTIPDNYLANRDKPAGRMLDKSVVIPVDKAIEKLKDKQQDKMLFDIKSLFGNYNSIKTVIPQGECTSGIEVQIDYEGDNPCIGISAKKEIAFTLKNNTTEERDGILKLETPEGWTGPESKKYTLQPGGVFKWTVSVNSNEVVKPSYALALKVNRYHDDHIWSTYYTDFALVAAANWFVKGPANEDWIMVGFSGNKIDFDSVIDTSEDGVYYAKTTLYNPSARKVVLIGGTDSGIKITLDGKVIVDDPQVTRFVPAYHRAPGSKTAELELSAGRHSLEVEVIKEGRPLQVYILPVATRQVKKPGAKYYYTDVLFIR